MALSENGVVLGVITEALGFNYKPLELGFFAVLSVEPIYECLARHKLLPDNQTEGWDDFWNKSWIHFVRDAEKIRSSGSFSTNESIADLSVFDDGKRYYFLIISSQNELRTQAIEAAICALGQTPYEEVAHLNIGTMIIIGPEVGAPRAALKIAVDAATAVLVGSGLEPYSTDRDPFG